LQKFAIVLSLGKLVEVSHAILDFVVAVPGRFSSGGEDSDVTECQSCRVLFALSRRDFGHKLHRITCERLFALNTVAVAFLKFQGNPHLRHRVLIYNVTVLITDEDVDSEHGSVPECVVMLAPNLYFRDCMVTTDEVGLPPSLGLSSTADSLCNGTRCQSSS